MRATPSWDAVAVGGGLCLGGFGLLFVPSLLAAPIGLEAIALAFWLWARAAEDAREQIPRWAWLRRPAMALWIAVACHAVSPSLTHPIGSAASLRENPLAWVEAAAVLWAGLELVAALPLARAFSDFPGPHLQSRTWIPVALPSAGFLLLWRQVAHWDGIPAVRSVAIALLLFTALLGTLRAYARRGRTASLRWLAVTQTALAITLLPVGLVPAEPAFLLWIGAFSAPAFLLAGELSGVAPRRGVINTRLWRSATFVSTASLAWPALLGAARVFSGALLVLALAAGATASAISTWIMVGYLTVAPERRRVMRPGAGAIASRLSAILVLLLGPVGLAGAWWSGFEPRVLASALAIAPAAAGAAMALARKGRKPLAIPRPVLALAATARPAAAAAYRAVVGVERGLLRGLVGFSQVLSAPLGDLHTGDAQEYLLFLIGVGVLVLLLPLLR